MNRPALLILVLISLPVFAQLSEPFSWEVKPIFPWVRKLVYLNDRFIAGGFDGEVMQSLDGEVWSGTFTGRRSWLTDFAFVAGKYYAPQREDLLVSTNLVDWQRLTNKFQQLTALLHRDGVFLAAGFRIWRSTNGKDWEMLPFRPRSTIESLAYGNGVYIGTGFETIISSTNGIDWQEVSRTGGHEVAFGNDRFVAVGNGVNVSTNGQDWTRHAGLREPYGIAFGGGRFVVVTGNGAIFSSTDATTWTETAQVTENLLHSVAYGANRFVVGGWGPVLASQDGTNFNRIGSSPRGTRAIAQGNGMLVIAGGVPEGGRSPEWTNQPALFTSRDSGATWRFQPVPWTESIRALEYLNDRFIAVGESGLIATSDDARQWTIAKLDSEIWQAIAYGAGKYVVGGGYGPHPPMAISSDGTNWVMATTTFPEAVMDIVYREGRFVAVGGGITQRNGFAASSTNGMDWEYSVQGLADRLLKVAFGNGRFLAVGQNGSILTSLNGNSWEEQPRFTTNHLTAVHFAAGLFVSAANAGTHNWSSRDGQAWTAHDTGFAQSYTEVGFADGRFFLTGSEHWLVRSAVMLPRLEITTEGASVIIKVHTLPGAEATLQTSSDLLSWAPLKTVPVPEPDGSAIAELQRTLQRQFVRVLSPSSP